MRRALCLLALGAAACTDHLPLVGAPCPCATPTVCDVASHTCLAGTGDGAADVAAPEPDAAVDTAVAEPDVALAQPDALPADAASAVPPVADAPPWQPADGAASDDAPAGEPDGGYACPTIGINTVQEFETQFLIPRCAGSGCHQAIFPPRNLNHLDMIRQMLVDVPSVVLCKSDRYIDTTNVEKSFMLAKVVSTTADVQCPNGGAPNSGGTRMPNPPGMAGIAGPRLTDAEIKCYTWWVYQLAKP